MAPGYQGRVNEEDFPLHHKNFEDADFSPGVQSDDDERDEKIKSEILDKLGQYPSLDTSDLHIDVKDGYISLNGTVNSLDEKSTIEAMVGNIEEVMDVANFIKVRKGYDSGLGNGLHHGVPKTP